MDKKQRKVHTTDEERRASREELTYNIIMWTIIFGVIFGFSQIDVYKTKKEAKLKSQIEAYVKNFPNYDDSIRVAKTNEELQRTINRREQVQMNIAHYADSLYARNR